MVASIMFDRLPPSRESQSNKMGAIATEVETCDETLGVEPLACCKHVNICHRPLHQPPHWTAPPQARNRLTSSRRLNYTRTEISTPVTEIYSLEQTNAARVSHPTIYIHLGGNSLFLCLVGYRSTAEPFTPHVPNRSNLNMYTAALTCGHQRDSEDKPLWILSWHQHKT